MKFMTGWLVVISALVSSLLAHHALINHDTSKAVRVKGTVVQFYAINPHSFIYVEEKGQDGQVHRWAVEGPSVLQLDRRNFEKGILKPGDAIEVCGYLPKEAVTWQIANADPGGASLAGRLITAELIVTADGVQRSWGDYGFHKCFGPEFRDQHSK